MMKQLIERKVKDVWSLKKEIENIFYLITMIPRNCCTDYPLNQPGTKVEGSHNSSERTSASTSTVDLRFVVEKRDVLARLYH